MSICLFGMFVMTERIRQFAAAFALCSCAVYTIRITLHMSVRGLEYSVCFSPPLSSLCLSLSLCFKVLSLATEIKQEDHLIVFCPIFEVPAVPRLFIHSQQQCSMLTFILIPSHIEPSTSQINYFSYYTFLAISRLPVCYPKFLRIKYTKLYFMPVLLYRCKTCCLTLGVEHRLRVFENRVLRGIFGRKVMELVMGGWEKVT
jgi:hypothetical protein